LSEVYRHVVSEVVVPLHHNDVGNSSICKR